MAIDRYLQHVIVRQQQQQQQQEVDDDNDDLLLSITTTTTTTPDRVIKSMAAETARKRQQLQEQYRKAPAMFECVIRRAYPMGGSHGLPKVQVGEVVQVLQEGVGPDQQYNLCRRRQLTVRKDQNGQNGQPLQNDDDDDSVVVGWYPIGFMEKIDPPKKKRWFGIMGR